jgi:hypothetical protein
MQNINSIMDMCFILGRNYKNRKACGLVGRSAGVPEKRKQGRY